MPATDAEPDQLPRLIADTTALLARVDRLGDAYPSRNAIHQAGLYLETALTWLRRTEADQAVAARTPELAS